MARSAIVLALGVALINIFLLSNDAIFAAAENPWDRYVNVDPNQSQAAVKEIAKYTPILGTIDPAAVSVALRSNGTADFLPKPDSAQKSTEASTLEQSYTVQKGDTISTIAGKFGLHVATILERNQLSVDSIDSLKPDAVLVIPATDTSDSTDWLTAVNEKKLADAKQRATDQAKADKKKQASLASASGSKNSRKTTTRDRSSRGYDGADQGVASFIVPIHYTAIARGVGHGHDGIDYDAPIGTPAHVTADGRVIEITGGWGSGFGNSILVDHGGGLTTRYAHLSSVEVSVGESVNQGDEIGLSGNTGFSTGPHLHFQTEINRRVISPF